MELSFNNRIQHAWNAFKDKEPFGPNYRDTGPGNYTRPDRVRLNYVNTKSIIGSLYNRLALDIASVTLAHVRLDGNDKYLETIRSSIHYALTTEANIDQTGRSLMMDIAMSMFDEGCVAVVPIETTCDPTVSSTYDIQTLRVGRIIEWFPTMVKIELYNEKTGYKEPIVLPKSMVAIIENPLFAVMNEQNSTLQRLIRKLNLLDAVDEQSGSGKLDLIIQLPYVIKTEARRQQADIRRKDIEMQLSGSKYGIAYTDGTEKVTQLNRPAENNLMAQVTYLTSMLYNQLGLTENIFNGTADEKEMLNYFSRTIEPCLSSVTDEYNRKFLTKTARTQRQAITYFRDPFRFVPVTELANVADKFTRNEVLTSNEVRSIVGYKPSTDPKAEELRNKNLNKVEPVPQPQSDINEGGIIQNGKI